ncbi:hypothetical protein H4R18_000209 [Coemansia javaensis]|uniref:HIRAN domain-containing protein n=1 Tax=Coemansia javaensis TaxID=2761396 RepID=A0A9W8HIU9_9FUNG|nr:hypothetical protein H4R18_000209 [Coemansia javaensis]
MTVSFGTFSALIVGRRYYAAHAAAGERIELRREPHNPHDANAIAAYTAGGDKLGHLSRWLARVLAPCVDEIGCALGGTVTAPGSVFATPISVDIHAPARAAAALRRAVGTYWSMWQLSEPPQSCSGGGGSAGRRVLVVSTARGIGDWIGHVSLSGAGGQQVSWAVYSPALPLECVASSQAVFVCVADAAHLLSRLGTAHWTSIALDRTAIGDELLAATPEITRILSCAGAAMAYV